MVSIKDAAETHVPTSSTQNITDLEKVSVDVELHDDTFEFEKNGVTKTVEQQVIIENDIKYRVPKSVLTQLKAHMAEMPNMKFFKVKSTGTGMDTRYMIFPVTE